MQCKREFLMESNVSGLLVVLIILALSSSPHVLGSLRHDPGSLDAFIFNYTSRLVQNHPTGILYNISLPSNFSGIEVSAIRLRSSTFWTRGANISFLGIPPRVLPLPYTRRLAIVYMNLGNLSSSFYRLSDHRLLAPVLGFMVIDATNKTRSQKLDLGVRGERINIRFSRLDASNGELSNARCVKLHPKGIIELSSMVSPYVCSTQGPGYFSIAVTNQGSDSWRVGLWEWRFIGFVAGLGGLALVGLIVVAIYRGHTSRRVKAMEKDYGKEESLRMKWIGRNKVPTASMTRTHGVLETDHGTLTQSSMSSSFF
ncbi:hypothetical protein Drorol1_Dr00004869 [Drosera rotundifolia]